MTFTILEIGSVVCACVYLVLLSNRNIWCWAFGITGSVIGVGVMHKSGLNGQVILHIYYALVGIYGWWHWSKNDSGQLSVVSIKYKVHIGIILLGLLCATVLGLFLSSKQVQSVAFADSAITVFAIMASLMQARRWLSSWVYWFVINIASVGLYISQSLYGYTLLMSLYTALCIRGYVSWKKTT
jgi:nicotinamide mononucleotide transporter